MTIVDDRVTNEGADESAAKEMERARRATVAAELLVELPQSLYQGLMEAPERIQGFLRKGSWKTAARMLDEIDRHDLAGMLRLRTPYLLDH